MSERELRLPTGSELSDELGFDPVGIAGPLLESSLLTPLGRFLSKRGKRLRTQLLEFAVRAVTPEATEVEIQTRVEQGSYIVESIHSASIIIDDIEDGSLERRGAATLHREVGVPVALNAGNWLYFYPLSTIPTWNLKPATELKVFRLCMSALSQAHCGQAIDVGVSIDTLPQGHVREACLASLRLKTGALTGLAASLGAALAEADDQATHAFENYGVSFGMGLQMFDDIGNLSSARMGPKQYEDLLLRRPTWVWACAAVKSESVYRAFCDAVRSLPNSRPLEQWLNEHDFLHEASREATAYLEGAAQSISSSIPRSSWDWATTASDRLRQAYA